MGAHLPQPMRRLQSESSIRQTGLGIGWVCVLAGLIARLYASTASINLWLGLAVPLAILALPTPRLRMRAVDWSALLLAAYEIPSLLFSQYRANGIRTAVAIAILALTYCAVRLTIRTNIQVAVFSGLVGLGGGWLALSGLIQFNESVNRLGTVGLTNLVAFRARLVSPPSNRYRL